MGLIVNDIYKKFAPLYILQILEAHTNENKRITYEGIKEKLAEDGFIMDRKAIARHVQDLTEIGYKIHGALPEYDEKGKPVKNKRGVWLEKTFSDENLQMLIDSVLFSKYIKEEDAKALIGKIREMGSDTFRRKNKGIAKVSSVYHARHVDFFKELNAIQQAIAHEKKLAFSYGKFKPTSEGFVFEGKPKTVDPYHLAFSNGRYYLIAYVEEKKEIGHFRVDKICKAKTLDLPAKPISDTSLKGVSIGEYLLSHPYLFTGMAERVTFRVDSEQIGHVFDTFGESFRVCGSDKRTTTISVNCNPEDAYYWALQFGGCVEVLEPQELRERLRIAVEEMSMRYLDGNKDRYFEAIRKSENNGDLDLTGVKLAGLNQHYRLNVKHLTLSDNAIDDISFVKNYNNLYLVWLYNNPIADLSPLSGCDKVHSVRLKNLDVQDLSALAKMKDLRSLDLEQCENVDGSAVYQMETLQRLHICGSVKNLDVTELKKLRPNLDVTVYEARGRMDFVKCVCTEYPLNVLQEALGYNTVFVGDEEEALEAVEEVLLRLPAEEREVATLVFKEKLGEAEISNRLKISVDEISRLKNSYMKKLKHKAYNRGLERFLTVKDPNSTNAMERIKARVGYGKNAKK